MNQKVMLVPESRQMIQQLLRISESLNQLYQDQMQILGDIDAQNIFKLDQEKHQIGIANGLFELNFYSPQACATAKKHDLLHCHFYDQGMRAEAIEHFILHEIQFLTGDMKPQHSLFLRNKAKHFRKLLIDQTYAWVNGRERVRIFLQNMSFVQAEVVDQLMICAQQYQQPLMLKYVQEQQPIPEQLLERLCEVFTLDVLAREQFLPLQALMESLDNLCCSASEFLPRAMQRIVGLIFEERFSLQDFINHQEDIQLLYRHAEQHSALLGFVRLMHRDYWQQDDSLAKANFLAADSVVWQEKVAELPIFASPRAVNWLFKQSSEVLDWLSGNIQHSSVRVAVTALSYVDCSRVHPQVILTTLMYFQFSAAQMFIHRCYFAAIKQNWFAHANNTGGEFKDLHGCFNEQRVAISPSILYLEEWMGLMDDVIGRDDQAVKHVYLRLSRIMQAYMQHLAQISQDLPTDVMPYIRVETQQDRDFLAILYRHHIQLRDFRQRFYLQDGAVRESIFDGYVRDYLADYFAQNKPVPKNTTWTSLFLQAVTWHEHIQKQEILAKLKKQLCDAHWTSMTPEKSYPFADWQFEELKDLDRIINESKVLHHCLAASYAQRVIEGEYVAFHMSKPQIDQHLTLGCYLRDGQLMFDQLEYAHNQKANVAEIQVATQFIEWLNAQLSSSK